MPEVTSFNEARKNLASTMDKACEGREPVIITRPSAPAVVLLSLEDYNSLLETAYLLGTPANARRLQESLEAIASGRVQEHALLEVEPAEGGVPSSRPC